MNVTSFMASGHWVQVSKRPPTFYPRGVSANCKTDCNSGEWVYAGDAAGSRFFIPLHGLGNMSRKTLVNEALAARSEQLVDQIAAEDRAYNAKRLLFNSVFIPIYAIGSAGGAGGSCVSSPPRKKIAR